MTDKVDESTANAGNPTIESKWNDLPPEVKAKFLEAIEAEKSSVTSDNTKKLDVISTGSTDAEKSSLDDSPTVDNTVKLNVGGTVFQTSKSTLTKFDGFFKTMLETSVPIAKDSSGCIFIDRSAKHFELILNFMRDVTVELPETLKEIHEVQNEAEYYLLDDLVEHCISAHKKLLSTWTGLSRELRNDIIKLEFTRYSAIFTAGQDQHTYEMEYPKSEDLKHFDAFADILKNNKVERIVLDSVNYSSINGLENLIPSQSVQPKELDTRGFVDFEAVQFILKMCWNEMESIDLSCYFVCVPIDQLFEIKSFIYAATVYFNRANSNQLIKILDKWLSCDPDVGKEVALKVEGQQGVNTFEAAIKNRVIKNAGRCITIRTGNPDKHVTVKILYRQSQYPMIYCKVVTASR